MDFLIVAFVFAHLHVATKLKVSKNIIVSLSLSPVVEFNARANNKVMTCYLIQVKINILDVWILF